MNDLASAAPTGLLEDSGSACIGRARGLIPVLQGAAERIDAGNELPPDVLDAMFDAGMFKLLLPRAYGGSELKPLDYIHCVEAIAQGDASAAWCMNQGSGCSMASAHMQPDVAREIWGGKRDVVAGERQRRRAGRTLWPAVEQGGLGGLRGCIGGGGGGACRLLDCGGLALNLLERGPG